MFCNDTAFGLLLTAMPVGVASLGVKNGSIVLCSRSGACSAAALASISAFVARAFLFFLLDDGVPIEVTSATAVAIGAPPRSP